MADFMEVSEVVAKIGAAFPNWKPDKFTVQVYFDDLRDLDRVAANKCRTENGRKFAPSTGELRGAVADIRRTSSGVLSSYEAWQVVNRQIVENGGDFGKPVWSHPIIEKTVKAIGWRTLRMSEDPTSDRMRFIQAYEQFEKRMMDDEMELPEVREYIESHGGKLLSSPSETMKKLTAKLEAK